MNRTEEERETDNLIAKLQGLTSCGGCKFLYSQDDGYSNYTVTDTTLHCSLDKNPNLPADLPYNWVWNKDTGYDNWGKTSKSRCLSYDYSAQRVSIDVDRFEGDYVAADEEAAEAVRKHSGLDKVTFYEQD